jgi:hypothetical protein
MFDKFYNTLTDGIYSIMDLDFVIDTITPAKLLTNEALEARYTPVYLNSVYNSGIKHLEGVFKHSNGYYIHLIRDGGDLANNFKIRIIYKIEKYEEIKLYINSLKKTQNGTNGNRT